MKKVSSLQSKVKSDVMTVFSVTTTDGEIRIWRSDNGQILKRFRNIWPTHKFLTVVIVNTLKEQETLGYEVALTDKQVDEQINIYKDEITKAGAMHRKELGGDKKSLAGALSYLRAFFKGCLKRCQGKR